MKKIKLSMALLLSSSMILSAGCSDRRNLSPMPTISEQAKKDIESPVNCANAQNDIAVLESEKASVAKQVLSGVRSVLPIAVVAGILMGDYRDRIHVTTGSYNKDLEAKIEEIKQTCNLE